MLKTDIIANVSHELGTPLLQVKSAVSLLAEDMNQGGSREQRLIASMATQAVARLEGVVNNIRQLARTRDIQLAPVVMHEGVAGLFCGPVHEAWAAAADLSSKRHVVWLDQPVKRVLSIMPAMYDDLWVAAKGMYKMEPAVADGGEVVIYAPHVTEVSHVHGTLIDRVGYHCKDYFVKQWDRFRDVPGGILAHSTHVKGLGSYDPATGVETPRIRVTLATGIPRERCERIDLGYLDPASVDLEAWKKDPDTLVVLRAGEMLYRCTTRAKRGSI